VSLPEYIITRLREQAKEKWPQLTDTAIDEALKAIPVKDFSDAITADRALTAILMAQYGMPQKP